MQNKIIIKGAREHNLKNISLELPRDKMIVFTGLSGSGKSSLAFDTIFAEGQRRYIESLSAYARQFLGRLDKPDVDEIEGLSPAISIDQKSHSANPRSTVATITEIYDYLRVLFARAGKPFCPECGREIKKLTAEEIVDTVIEISKENKSAKNLLILAPVVRGRKGEYYQLLYDFLNAGFREARIDGMFRSLRDRVDLSRYKTHTIDIVVDRIPHGVDFKEKDNRLRLAEAVESALKHGNNVLTVITDKEVSLSAQFTCAADGFSFPEIEPRLFSFNSPYGACPECHGLGTKDVWSEEICPVCIGKRLRKESLSVKLDGRNIVEVTAYSVGHAYEFFGKLEIGKHGKFKDIAEVPLREIRNRLKFMIDVGLEYLTLDRKAGTLSGGESQRIRLASQIGSRLVGTLYILDEPTIGLHQKDNAKLIKTLHDLRDLGNTIIVVEHDEETIRESDYLVDIGPGAGVHGGRIIAHGPIPEILTARKEKQESLTLDYLRGKQFIAVPEERRKIGKAQEYLKVKGATENNLKNIDAAIPLRKMTAITGVSGSGKSTLIYDVLYKTLSNKFNASNYNAGAHKGSISAVGDVGSPGASGGTGGAGGRGGNGSSYGACAANGKAGGGGGGGSGANGGQGGVGGGSGAGGTIKLSAESLSLGSNLVVAISGAGGGNGTGGGAGSGGALGNGGCEYFDCPGNNGTAGSAGSSGTNGSSGTGGGNGKIRVEYLTLSGTTSPAPVSTYTPQ